jgi:hypothetical protein
MKNTLHVESIAHKGAMAASAGRFRLKDQEDNAEIFSCRKWQALEKLFSKSLNMRLKLKSQKL